MRASEAAFMQPEDRIHLYTNMIHGVLGICQYGAFIPTNEPIIIGVSIGNFNKGISIEDFNMALMNLKHRGLIKVKTINHPHILCFVKWSNTT